MAWDGLTNPYDGKAMGVFGECRLRQVRLHPRGAGCVFGRKRHAARRPAQRRGAFDDEIVPVTVKTRKGEVVVDSDEEPGKIDIAKIPTLRPAFSKDGMLTAASPRRRFPTAPPPRC